MTKVEIYASDKEIFPDHNGEYCIGKDENLKFKINLDNVHPCTLYVWVNANERFTYHSVDNIIEISSYEDCLESISRSKIGLPLKLQFGERKFNSKILWINGGKLVAVYTNKMHVMIDCAFHKQELDNINGNSYKCISDVCNNKNKIIFEAYFREL